jgi:hypothetical protein
MLTVLAFAAAALSCFQIAPTGAFLVAPAGPMPTLDGTIQDDEWRGAKRTHQGTIELLTRTTPDGGLALGIHAPAYAITSVYLRVNDTITVLHASAAIGDVTYVRQPDGAWKLTNEFVFTRYRDVPDFTARHEEFLQKHRWVSTHARLGAPGDTELFIAPDLLGGKTGRGGPRLAVTYYDPDVKKVLLAAPAGLADAAIQPEINAGFTAATLRFEPDTWISVIGEMAAGPANGPDYGSLYAKGSTFADFLDRARMLRQEWLANDRQATIDESVLARARALKGRWQLLAVADDSCHDSVNTLPYVAKLSEAVPDTLSLRIVSSEVGEAVKEAHRTPDGRAATPTIVVLDERGALKGVFVERPAALLQFIEENGAGKYPDQVRELRYKWYAEDKGRHALGEILDIIEK